MITPFGVFLRKLRLDNGEIMKNMAEKLEVSSSFLSAVENGKKNIPTAWFDMICGLYDLNENKKEELRETMVLSQPYIKIDLNGLSKEKRSLAFSFKKNIKDMKKEDVDRFNRLFYKKHQRDYVREGRENEIKY